MKADKLRVFVDYEKLDEALKEQIKLVYPTGFSQHLISFNNAKGERVSALRFETFEKIYLIKMSIQMADKIVEDDDDFDDDGNLKEDVREKYEEEHSDVDYLSENDNYDVD
ncbi:MAG: hypothetical protein KDC92_02645 [Bacteroidetes bacterium]|nr:hypothetical protein [Bacteroidota bacterium]